MQFTIILACAAVAMAAPLESRQVFVCSSGSPVCCATDVLGVADLDCAPPPKTPASADDFIATCSAIGQQAKCCLLPILEQALVCTDVTPSS